jgi:hypothetical protein
LTTNKPIDTEKLLKEAQAAEHKEAYKLIARNEIFRVGVGARINSLEELLFFVEVNLKLSTNSNQVNLHIIEKTLEYLKMLQARGYTLTYQDGNCVSCEKTELAQNLTKESIAVTTLMKSNITKQS